MGTLAQFMQAISNANFFRKKQLGPIKQSVGKTDGHVDQLRWIQLPFQISCRSVGQLYNGWRIFFLAGRGQACCLHTQLRSLFYWFYWGHSNWQLRFDMLMSALICLVCLIFYLIYALTKKLLI